MLSVNELFLAFYSLFGVQSNGWVVVKVDMRPIFSTTCVDADYYNWMPFDDVCSHSL